MWELSALRALWRFLISWLSFSLPKHMGVYSGTRVHRFKLDSTTSQLCDLNRLLDCSDGFLICKNGDNSTYLLRL